MRRVDMLGITGLLMLVAGAGTFVGAYSVLPLWIVWLVGPLCWYLGFAVVISWMLCRLFGALPATKPEAEEQTSQKVIAIRSNFLEHDYEVPMEPRMRKVPVFGTLLVLLFIFTVMIYANAADSGAALFTSKCAACHGADAAGKTPMGAKMNIRSLVSPEVQKQSDAELSQIIAKGKNKMPAYEAKLSKDDIAQLTAHIRGLAKKH
jgi:mono/diheme cytochrome c family protein